MDIIESLTGIKTNPPKYIDAEYARAARRSTAEHWIRPRQFYTQRRIRRFKRRRTAKSLFDEPTRGHNREKEMTYEEAKKAVEKAKEALKNLPATATWWDTERAKRALYTAQIRAKQLEDEDGGDGGDGNGGGSSGAAPTKHPKHPK